MLLVYCFLHREILVSKLIPPMLNTKLKSIKKFNNAIQANAKCEDLFKTFCENKNTDHGLHTPDVCSLHTADFCIAQPSGVFFFSFCIFKSNS